MPTTMINEYERRLQRSIQKLTIPAWYNEANVWSLSSPHTASKSSIAVAQPIPIQTQRDQSYRTPEIVHVRRPHSYRSCRSSLATSPSPSIHSWHPNHMPDGLNLSLLMPMSARRRHKYEKGIERVSKSSHWYQPTRLTPHRTNDQAGRRRWSFLAGNRQHSIVAVRRPRAT